MKHILLLIILVIGSIQMNGQTAYVSGKTGYVSLNGFTPRLGHGIGLDVQAAPKVFLHWNFLLGNKYIHGNAGPPAGVAAFVYFAGRETDSTKSTVSNIGTGILFGAILSLIPEGISYKLRVNKNFDVSPIFSPLQMDFIKKDNQISGTDTYIGLGAGILANSYLMQGKLKITLHTEYKIHYNIPVNNGYFVGLSLGYRFYNNDDDFSIE